MKAKILLRLRFKEQNKEHFTLAATFPLYFRVASQAQARTRSFHYSQPVL